MSMNGWMRHLARSIFRLGPDTAAGATAAFLVPAPPMPPPPPPRIDPDGKLLRDCASVLSRRDQELERLGAIPSGEWERFAAEIGRSDDRSRDLLLQICRTPTHTADGLRIKAETLSLLLEDPEPGAVDDEVEATMLREIARALVTDILAMLDAEPERFGR
jgi:hypothetical protein